MLVWVRATNMDAEQEEDSRARQEENGAKHEGKQNFMHTH